MKHYKRLRFDRRDWELIEGKKKHEVEIPFAEDLDLWVEYRSTSSDTSVWLYFTDGKMLPYASGSDGLFNIRTQELLSVVIKCSEKASVALSVSYRDLSVTDKLDYTPVPIKPPASAQLDLSSILSAEVRRQLEERGVLTPLEVSEEDNLELDDDVDEFGPGYMEEDEEVVATRKAAKAAKASSKSVSAAAVDVAGDVGSGELADNPPGAPPLHPGKP